jgi:hypothetical protein
MQVNWTQRHLIIFAFAGLWLGSASRLCVAQTSRATETEVEAAYLYNFGKFVNWPPEQSSGAFAICVLGKDPFGEVLDSTVAGENINSRKVTIARIGTLREATACQVLFITDREEARLKMVLAGLKGAGVLTVSDMPHFADRGGMIGLVEVDGRIRFEVNLKAAQESHLNLSSELLKVAVKVIGKPETGDHR